MALGQVSPLHALGGPSIGLGASTPPLPDGGASAPLPLPCAHAAAAIAVAPASRIRDSPNRIY
jgi:hypothetical protein